MRTATDINKAIGRKIQELRLSKGMSAQQLAEQIGVTQQQVRKYEIGENRVSAGRLAMIAEALDVAPSYFFVGAENAITPPSCHQRMAIQASRNFMMIKDPQELHAINSLLTILARKERDKEL